MVTKSKSTQKRTASDTVMEPKNWRDAESRSERSKLIREGLFAAAAEIVGDVGYKDASVSLIVQRAGVAQGTFYNHFESRQDILDQLLPATGRQLLAYIQERAQAGTTMLDKEELRIRIFSGFSMRRKALLPRPIVRIWNWWPKDMQNSSNGHAKVVSCRPLMNEKLRWSSLC